MPAKPTVIDVGAGDQALLEAFLRDLYIPSFPDPDERESEDNIRRYLELREQGWYGLNRYRLLLVMRGERAVAGAIFDYLEKPNGSVIEFITVAPDCRAGGIGGMLVAEIRRLTAEDARRAGRTDEPWIFGETEDPYRAPPSSSPDDPFTRLEILESLGALRIVFPYIQPALAPGKRAVRHLHLVAAPPCDPGTPAPVTIPAERVRVFLREYMRWAMRIEQPGRNSSYRFMARSLLDRSAIALEPLSLESLAHRKGQFVEPEDPGDPRIDRALRIYDEAIGDPAVKVPLETFRESLRAFTAAGRPGLPGGSYHFVMALEPGRPERVLGMLSAFVLGPHAFIGYVALAPGARGRGLGRDLVRWAGRLAVRDARERGEAFQGTFAEVDGGVPPGTSPQYRFTRSLGFHEVPIAYRQPAVTGAVDAPPAPLVLLYRPAWPDRRLPDRRALRSFLRRLGTVVFGLEGQAVARFVRDGMTHGDP